MTANKTAVMRAQAYVMDRRLRILVFVNSSTGRTINSAVLQDLLEQTGHIISADLLRTELAWLEEQGLLLRHEFDDLIVVKITERGVDAACGRTIIPGIKNGA